MINELKNTFHEFNKKISKKRNKNADIILEKIQKTFADKQVTLQCDGFGDVFASESYKNFFGNIDKNFNLHIITNGNLITKNQNLIEKYTLNLSYFKEIKNKIDKLESLRFNMNQENDYN